MASPTRRVAGGDPGAGAADRRRERAPGRWRLVAVGGGWWNQKDREDAARKCGKINWKKVWIMD